MNITGLTAVLSTQPIEMAGEFARFQHRGWVDTLHARFIRHGFSRHSHDTYSFGAVLAGVEGFWHEGTRLEAPAGTIVFYRPGDVHDGYALAPQGWEYRMLNIDAGWFRNVAWEAGLQSGRDYPGAARNTLNDPGLFEKLCAAHKALEASQMLAGTSLLVEAVISLLTNHGETMGRIRPAVYRPAVRRAMELLRDRMDDNVTLEELAQVGGISRFHLLDSFKAATGLPPHRWQLNLRMWRAKQLLAQKATLPEIALDLGFHDQSHFTNAFKRHLGVTPAAYRRAVT